MRHDTLADAVAQAKRFIAQAAEAMREDAKVKDDLMHRDYFVNPQGFERPSKHAAAVRRASMDLTRALADLRNREKQ